MHQHYPSKERPVKNPKACPDAYQHYPSKERPVKNPKACTDSPKRPGGVFSQQSQQG